MKIEMKIEIGLEKSNKKRIIQSLILLISGWEYPSIFFSFEIHSPLSKPTLGFLWSKSRC